MFVDVNSIEMFKRFHLISHMDPVVISNLVSSITLCFYAFMKALGTLVGGDHVEDLR